MNEKIREVSEYPAEQSLTVVEQENVAFEQIGHIEFEGLSKLKSSLFGGYNKESVLDIIDKIIEQSETQLSSMKRFAKVQESRNTVLNGQNDSLREEISKLMCQLKEDQEDFTARLLLKEQQIDLLQRENRQLREKIMRDKKILIERIENQFRTQAEEEQEEASCIEKPPQQEEAMPVEFVPKIEEVPPIERTPISKDVTPIERALKHEKPKNEVENLRSQIEELLNTGALSKQNLEKPAKKTETVALELKKVPVQASEKRVFNIPVVAKPTKPTGGDKNWDLDSILEEYGD